MHAARQTAAAIAALLFLAPAAPWAQGAGCEGLPFGAPFPCVPVVDTFSGPEDTVINQGPCDDWVDNWPPAALEMRIDDQNRLKTDGTVDGSATGTWKRLHAENMEVYVTYAVVPSTQEGSTLVVRSQDPVDYRSGLAYHCEFLRQAGTGDDLIALFRRNRGEPFDNTFLVPRGAWCASTPSSCAGGDYQDGDQLGMRIVGDEIGCYVNGVLIATAVDDGSLGGAPIQGPGWGAIFLASDAPARFDDFGTGSLDPGPPLAPPPLNSSEADQDQDGVTPCQGDCDDMDPRVSPLVGETCNGRDDDCDGLIDEDAAGVDSDGDGVPNACDNCVTVANLAQQDADSDGVGDVCDNCPGHPNESQIDRDSDGEGDACDLDDGFLGLTATAAEAMHWQEDLIYGSFNVYRGDLGLLRVTGHYTQDPGTVPLAARFCGLPGGPLADAPSLAVGQAAHYLATGVSGQEESPPGTDGDGIPRPNHHPCP